MSNSGRACLCIGGWQTIWLISCYQLTAFVHPSPGICCQEEDTRPGTPLVGAELSHLGP